jgi:type IV pilus assembly protein PilN
VEALKPFIAEQNRLEAERKALEALLAIRENLKKGFVPGRTTWPAFIGQIPREGGRFPVALRSVGPRPSPRRRRTRRPKAGPLTASGSGWSSTSRARP